MSWAESRGSLAQFSALLWVTALARRELKEYQTLAFSAILLYQIQEQDQESVRIKLKENEIMIIYDEVKKT